jgi:hypothetical protein
MKRKNKSNIRIEGNKIIVAPSRNSKKTPEELQLHLNTLRNGVSVVKSKKTYSRKEKHRKSYY